MCYGTCRWGIRLPVSAAGLVYLRYLEYAQKRGVAGVNLTNLPPRRRPHHHHPLPHPPLGDAVASWLRKHHSLSVRSSGIETALSHAQGINDDAQRSEYRLECRH